LHWIEVFELGARRTAGFPVPSGKMVHINVELSVSRLLIIRNKIVLVAFAPINFDGATAFLKQVKDESDHVGIFWLISRQCCFTAFSG
jgi:hypothetical protein